MTEINSSDLDRQMGRQIDPSSVPTHIGGDQGAMEGVIQRGTDARLEEQGAGRYGVPIFNERDVGGNDFYGSSKIISISEAPPLNPAMEPKPAPPPKPMIKAVLPGGMPASLAAVMGTIKPQVPAPVIAPTAGTPKPVVPPLAALAGKPGVPADAKVTANLNVLASLGLGKKP